MRTFSLLAPLLACSVAFADEGAAVYAHQLARRDASGLNIVETALYNISNATQGLSDDISQFSSTTVLSLQAASAASVQTIYQAIAAVKPIGVLNTTEAVALTPIISQVAAVVNKTITNVINHKQAFMGLSPVILSSLRQQQNATIQFTNVTNSKLPTNLQSLSAQLTAPIFNSLAMGIAAYSTPNVNNDTSILTSGAAAGAVAGYGGLALISMIVLAICSI